MAGYLKRIAKILLMRIRNRGVRIQSGCSISLNTQLGYGVRILKNSRISNCRIGSFTYVGVDSKLSNVEVGSFCSIAQEVIIGLGAHPTDFVSTYPGFYSEFASGATFFGTTHNFSEQKSSKIGADVWIGARAIVLGGVEVGTGAIIATASVVTKDVPPYSIVAGIPAKVIRYRFSDELINQLLSTKWWEKEPTYLRQMAKFMNSPEMFLKMFNEK